VNDSSPVSPVSQVSPDGPGSPSAPADPVRPDAGIGDPDLDDRILAMVGRPDGPLAGTALYELEVIGAHALTPRMRRVELTGPTLGELDHRPGQDLMFRIPVPGLARPVNRRYTIRALDALAPRLTIDAVTHGDGPGAHWFAAARPGDRLDAIGPRGNVVPVTGVDWHLFVGDESALPALLVMAEALGVGDRAVLVAEVADAAEEQATSACSVLDLHWVHRGAAEPGRSTVLVDAVAALDLPDGTGHAYLGGEARIVGAVRRTLVDRGFAAERISPKSYWSAGLANAAHGEPSPDLIREVAAAKE
jgi:NADPH-dependent ferric siderophore reductase